MITLSFYLVLRTKCLKLSEGRMCHLAYCFELLDVHLQNGITQINWTPY